MTDDLVNKPAHYNQGSLECIDAIREALTIEEFRGYCKGNNLKYVWREKYKGGNQDLEKAAWYLNAIPKPVEKPVEPAPDLPEATSALVERLDDGEAE